MEVKRTEPVTNLLISDTFWKWNLRQLLIAFEKFFAIVWVWSIKHNDRFCFLYTIVASKTVYFLTILSLSVVEKSYRFWRRFERKIIHCVIRHSLSTLSQQLSTRFVLKQTQQFYHWNMIECQCEINCYFHSICIDSCNATISVKLKRNKILIWVLDSFSLPFVETNNSRLA